MQEIVVGFNSMMNSEQIQTERRGERGAALITTLLLAILLLSAGGALVLTTAMSATNAIDSTAEMQAYYGAEAGLQTTINTLRGNVYASSSTPVASFRSVVEPSLSNSSGDTYTSQNTARLSQWLTYDANNRVVVPGTDGMIAYAVTASDIDDTKHVTYSTSGSFDASTSGCTVAGTTLTCQSGVNSITLTYTPQSSTALMAYPSVAATLGSFRLTTTGIGYTIPAGSPAKFYLKINQTMPWTASDTIVANISGNVTAILSTLSATFSGSVVKADGTKYELSSASLNFSIGSTAVAATITAPQPKRILVRSVGYGPKGATKKLEMMLSSSSFDFDAPAVLTMRGSDDGSAMTFDTGSSGAKSYSGIDNAGAIAQLPTFAVSGSDISTADNGIKKHNTVDDPEIAYLDISSVPAGNTISTLPVGTPDFLQSASNARSALSALQSTAKSVNRYFTPSTTGGTYTVNDSNTADSKITFVDGDCNLDGGSGLLVVTGNLNMSGNPSFNGVILVLGTGSVNRNGGGNGNVYGAMVVAAFDRNGTGGFTAPFFNTNGGGNSTLQYDSVAVSKALGAVGVSVGGVREY